MITQRAAHNAVAFMRDRLLSGLFTEIMLDELYAASICNTFNEGKTDVEKLFIAVEALNKIAGRGMTGGGIARKALKEIQG